MEESIVREDGADTIPLKLIANGSRLWELTLAVIGKFSSVLCDCGIHSEQCDRCKEKPEIPYYASWPAEDAVLTLAISEVV